MSAQAACGNPDALHASVHVVKSDREGGMKKILAVLLCCWCSPALAQTAQELIDSGKNSDNIPTFGMGYRLNQYSPLNQINKGNVKRLVPVWTTSLANDVGELAVNFQEVVHSAQTVNAD